MYMYIHNLGTEIGRVRILVARRSGRHPREDISLSLLLLLLLLLLSLVLLLLLVVL